MPPWCAELREQVPQLAARLRIEARGRLVEEEQIRIARERARHGEPLFLAAGQLPTQLRRFDSSSTIRSSSSIGAAAMIERSEQPQRFFDRQLLGKLRLLQLHAEPLPQLTLVRPSSCRPRISTSPASGSSSPSRISIGGRLAGAVRAQQSEALAAIDAKRQPVDRDDISVAFDKIGATDADHELIL